jgi:hypothetical protein
LPALAHFYSSEITPVKSSRKKGTDDQQMSRHDPHKTLTALGGCGAIFVLIFLH